MKQQIHKSVLTGGLNGCVQIAVAGVGGNGSHLVPKLARLDHALGKLGKPRLYLTLFDPDRVSESNVGRQGFMPAEVGQFKAVALAQRINLMYGVRYESAPERFSGQLASSVMGSRMYESFDILITCVDTGAARREIWRAVTGGTWGLAPKYWLDLGNEKDFGQVWLGQFPETLHGRGPDRLLTVIERYPEHYDGSVPETDAPSCSHAEALAKQSLSINDHVTDWAFTLLTDLLLEGATSKQGYKVNLADGMALGQPVQRATKAELKRYERLFPKTGIRGRIESAISTNAAA